MVKILSNKNFIIVLEIMTNQIVVSNKYSVLIGWFWIIKIILESEITVRPLISDQMFCVSKMLVGLPGYRKQKKTSHGWIHVWLCLCLCVFNATSISVILWRSVLLVEETSDLLQVTNKLDRHGRSHVRLK